MGHSHSNPPPIPSPSESTRSVMLENLVLRIILNVGYSIDSNVTVVVIIIESMNLGIAGQWMTDIY